MKDLWLKTILSLLKEQNYAGVFILAEEEKKVERGPRSNQKLKIMYLMKILLECTDEDHDITLAEIVEKLKAYGVTAERKSCIITILCDKIEM